MQPIEKQIPSSLFLASRHRPTIPQLSAIALDTIPRLFASAEETGVKVTGPVVFIYHGITADMNAEFDLIIGLPISERPPANPSAFEIYNAPDFRALTLEYVGSLNEVTSGYGTLMTTAKTQNLTMTDECREIYKKFVAYDSPNNVVELQIGISG